MLARAYRAVSGTRLQGAVSLVFFLGLFRRAISTPVAASSALNILPSSPQTLPASSADLLNDSIPDSNGTTPSLFVLGPAANTNSTSVIDENQGWPPVPFSIPMREPADGMLRFTRVDRPGTARQAVLLREIVYNKLYEWLNRPGLFIGSHIPVILCYVSKALHFNTDPRPLEAAICGGFVKRKADVRLRMDFQSLSPHRAPLNYSWATSALLTYDQFTAWREPREVRFQILDGPRALAKLKVNWIP